MTATTADRRGIDRRVRRTVFHLPERRTGFDRRLPSKRITESFQRSLAWYRDRPGVIAAVLSAVTALNVADLLLTLRAFDRGAFEANPFMAALFDYDPVLAGWFKLFVGLGVVLVIWRMRRYRRILEVSLIALAGYTALAVYHTALALGGA